MKRELIATKDGSFTIALPEKNVTYRSVYGAIQESRHVFINAGFNYVSRSVPGADVLYLLEIGLGTGLNAFLTFLETEKAARAVHYTAVEPYPITMEEIAQLNYCSQLNRDDLKEWFFNLHQCEWERDISLRLLFTIYKSAKSLLDLPAKKYHLIYFDPFAPASEPELWSQPIFETLHSMLLPGGVLVTYSSKGEVRRTMLNAGFAVEKIPGPPGKREMIRAIKK